MGTTNILDLNNRLTKVEKGNVAQNSYTSLKNKPKINNVTLTGNKTLADIGAAAAADVGDITQLDTTDKSSTVAAINEVNENVPKGIVEKLSLLSCYGYSDTSINIDTIDNEFGYIMCIINQTGFSGTYPSGLDGNRALLIGMSKITSNNLPQFGVQIAFSFGSSKIAIRNVGFSESGSAWGDWTYITA